ETSFQDLTLEGEPERGYVSAICNRAVGAEVRLDATVACWVLEVEQDGHRLEISANECAFTRSTPSSGSFRHPRLGITITLAWEAVEAIDGDAVRCRLGFECDRDETATVRMLRF